MLSKRNDDENLRSILYVDDESANLTVFEMAFEDDYDVHVAGTAREAIKVLRKNNVDLLITDQRMPEMTGVQLLEAVSIEYPHMVRMVLTGYSDIQAIIQAINTGRIDQYVTKPYDPEVLKMSMDRELELKKLERRNQELVDKLKAAVQRAKNIREAFQKYVPAPVVKSLLDNPRSADVMAGEDRIVTVVFTSISGFQNLISERSPGEIVGFLNSYIDVMNRIILRKKGLLADICSDELMSVFGAPVSALENERNAVEAVSEMVRAMEEINTKHALPLFGRPVHIRVGVHRGEVIAGNIGSVKKMEYGVLGDTVNTASRIRDLTETTKHDVLISEAVRGWLDEDDFSLTSIGSVLLRGRGVELELFRLNGD